MRPSPHSGDRKRLVIVSLSLCTLFCLLVLQFYKIQIVEGDKWVKVAKKQHQLVVIEPFARGLFYSNTSIKENHPEPPRPFVVDVAKFHLYADPESIPALYRDEVCRQIARALQVRDVLKLRKELDKRSHSRKLLTWIEKEQKDLIEKWWFPFAKARKIPRNALFFISDYQRSYPFGKMLGQVLHTVREERDQTNQNIPTGGLEMIFNTHLQGKSGKRVILRSPRHPLDTGNIITNPEDGADIYLSINHTLQAIAEEEIEKAVVSSHAKGGWAIMMDPQTGEILALAQFPSFDPRNYREFFNEEKLKEHTRVKGITDPYEPGSTFKPIILSICLKANAELKKQGKKPLFSPDEKIATSGGHFPGRSTPLKDTRTHRFLNMRLGLQKSSNVYMATLVKRVIDALGEKWFRKALQETFGFGLKTGIELPSESAGLLPTPGKKHPNGALEWSAPTPYSLAMGHNVLVNSLQMLKAYAIIANGGHDIHPTIVRKIVKGDNVLIDNTLGLKNTPQLLEATISQEMVTAMKYVTKPGGTAPKADIPGYTQAGKTGTAEKIVNGLYSKSNYFSTFIGFAPAKNPRFVLLIAIDEPEPKFIPGVGKNHHGGNCAAPPFREIGLRTLQYLGIEPDDAEKKDFKEEIKALQELYKSWNG